MITDDEKFIIKDELFCNKFYSNYNTIEKIKYRVIQRTCQKN